MKKFLSLVLALVMTMSLVTISAGATEYKDFTDKDEIKYEEAVTVLNKLGIITGYSEGDFRPEGELTRGAAAKIIVSLLIGPEAAEALGNESSPYPDVPAGNNFAGVISFCKTSEIINGYGDGTFRPQGTLTGFAFAKMLLGALGYDGDVEGFSGAGWNMKVATLGHQAGLFDRITFNGNATVTREQACQLALNTLKATMVEYSGGMNITTSDGSTMVVNPNRDYKVSNQEFATHINNKKAGDKVDDNWYTVEFGEEHFVDLRMSKQETTAHDAFGRPSNEWSYKKVTIGTFPIEPDYVFTSQVARRDATDAAKNRATGLGSFKLTTEGDTTDIWTNGRLNDASDVVASITKVAQIADLTDNGTVVEVYIDDDAADFISDIVVIKSQLMEVRNVGSDYVSFQREDNKAIDEPSAAAIAYNQKPIDKTVENIQSEDDLYSVVSGLKAGDLVVVTPVAQDETGTTKYDVGDVYVPETVSGAITAVDTYGTNGQTAKDAVSVTVGGTKYSIALWARDLFDVDAEKVKITRKDVTLYLDRYGYAMKANDIGDTSDWFIIGRFYQTLVNNRIVTMAEGWDISGTEMTLNLGTANNVASGYYAGDLVRYTTSTSNNADWSISDAQTTLVGRDNEIKASDVYIPLVGEANDVVKTNTSVYVDKGIKFIYVNYDRDTDEVTSIEIRNGVQGAKITELEKDFGNGGKKAQAGYSVKDGAVEAVKVVVIKNESTDALSSNMLYIEVADGAGIKDENGNMIYKYTVAMMSPNSNRVEEKEIYSSKKLAANTFASYSAVENANYSEFYDLRAHNNYTETSVSTFEVTMGGMPTTNKYLMYVVAGSYDHVKGTSEGMWTADHTPMVSRDPRNASLGEKDTINFQGAVVVDLRTKSQRDAWTGYTDRIETADELYNFVKNAMDTAGSDMLLTAGEKTFELQLIINDNDTSNGFRHVDMIVITDEVSGSYTAPASTSTGLTLDSSVGTWTDGVLTVTAAEAATATVTLTASAGATMSVKVTAPVASGSLAGATGNTWTSTAPLTAGKATIVVTAEDGTTTAEYPLEIVVNDGVYRNTYALEKLSDGAGGYVGGEAEASWIDDGTDGVVEFDESTFALTAPVLLAGETGEGTALAQVTKALEWLGPKVNHEFTDPMVLPNGKISFVVDGNTRLYGEWDPAANAKVLVDVKADPDATATPTVVDANGTANKISAVVTGGTGDSSVTVDGKESPITDTDAFVTPGATYTKDVYTKWTGLGAENALNIASVTNAGGTTTHTYTIPTGGIVVSYDDNVEKVGNDLYVKEDAVFSATLAVTSFGARDMTVTPSTTGADAAAVTANNTTAWQLDGTASPAPAPGSHVFTWTAAAPAAAINAITFVLTEAAS